jgi:hypothetical protein
MADILGLLADAIGGGVDWMRDPRRTQQMQGIGGLLADTLASASRHKGLMGQEAAYTQQAMKAGRITDALRGGPAGAQLDKAVADAYNPAGITVFHGSPFRFSRFDPTKIGSGEGAQAYGYGHYVAESPDVARRYQMGLTQAKGQEVLYKNRPLGDLYSQIENKSMRLSGNAADIENQKLQLIEHMMLDKSPQELISYAKETGFNPSVINWLTNDVAKNTKIPGALYTIDLPDPAIARMLNWDAPLAQQSESVRNVLSRLAQTLPEPTKNISRKNRSLIAAADPSLNGADAYFNLGGYNNAGPTSSLLREAGIPGIRYLDEGSRGAGQGTSNFVVFPGEEDLLRILSVNGGLLTP